MKSRSLVMRLLLDCTERAEYARAIVSRRGTKRTHNRARCISVLRAFTVERALPRSDPQGHHSHRAVRPPPKSTSVVPLKFALLAPNVANSKITFQGTEFVSSSSKPVTDPLIPSLARHRPSPNLAVRLVVAVKWPTAASNWTPAVRVFVAYFPAAGPEYLAVPTIRRCRLQPRHLRHPRRPRPCEQYRSASPAYSATNRSTCKLRPDP